MPLAYDYSQPILLAIMSVVNAASHPARPGDAAALTISGKASPVAASSVFYSFTPTVHHARDHGLEFRIQNKPSWASFGRRHGTLYGVPQPGNAGTYSQIVITVSDGTTTAQLQAFTIDVVAPSGPAAVVGSE
jgi:Putative Ig domain